MATKPLRALRVAKGLRLCGVAVNRFRGEAAEVERLMARAADLYPKLVDEADEWHHVAPLYLGGAKDGARLKLPRPYHQLITNEFRKEWGYAVRGKPGRRPTTKQLWKIMENVYTKYPLPPA
jgi:hypothetical protein